MFLWKFLQKYILQIVFRKLSKGGEGGRRAWKKEDADFTHTGGK